MKKINILIIFLSIIAFFIAYLIFFNNDFISYENFAVENAPKVATPKEASKEAPTASPKEAPKEAPTASPKEAPKEAAPKEAAPKEAAPKEAAEEVSEEVSEGASEEVSEGASEEVSEGASEEASEGASEEASEGASEEVTKKDIRGKSFDQLRKDKELISITVEPLFNDVVTHENNYKTNKSGLDECIETCNGMCVEFGQTSHAHCYPNPAGVVAKSTFYESLRDKTYRTENNGEKPNDLKFPNFR